MQAVKTLFEKLRTLPILLFFLIFPSSFFIRGQGVSRDSLVADEQEMFYGLLDGEGATLKTHIEEVLNNPDYYDPPVLFVFAFRLFQEGQKEQAVFWFYLARVRSQFSVNLAEKQLRRFAEKKINLYVEYFGTSIEEYALSHWTVLRPALEKIEVYLQNHRECYNLLWPYTDSKSSPISQSAPFATQADWNTIREETLLQFKANWQKLVGN